MTDTHEPIVKPRKKRSDALPEEERIKRRRATSNAWKAKNKERVSEYRSQYFQDNKEKERENYLRFIAENPGKKSEYDALYRERHRGRILTRTRSQEHRNKANARQRERYATDLDYRLRMILRASFRQALRLQSAKKRESVLSLIGCSVDDLVQHLTSQFAPGMTWENYGELWEIDHIRPCASFDMTLKEDRQACWHWTNLQPLTQEDNRRKSDNWPG